MTLTVFIIDTSAATDATDSRQHQGDAPATRSTGSESNNAEQSTSRINVLGSEAVKVAS